MQSEKSSTTTPFCKVCFKDVRRYDFASLFEDYPICPSCFNLMEPKTVVTMLDDIKTTSLFVYNEKVKQMLYQCKGCFDYEMAGIFLSRHRSFLRRRYKGWTLVPAPSYGSKDQVRGFNHVIEIFKGLEKPFIHAIEKTDNVKQADLNFVERQQIGKHLAWKSGVSVTGLNILFVDDLMTTGATAKACAKMLLEHGANKVEILVMARTIDPKKRKENEISFSQKLRQIVDGFKKKIRGERN